MPPWRLLTEDEEAVRADNPEPNEPKFGWQQKASRALHKKFCQEVHLPRLTEPERAMMRSQHGPLASSALTAVPTHRMTKIDPQLFRVVLRRRLGLSLPLSSRTCRCGRHLDPLGHHRAACSEAGVLGRRGFPLECAAAQVCREAGARVTTNAFVRDMDLVEYNALDGRRLEIVADGLTLWQGAQLAVDTTMVSPVRRDGTARPGAAERDGVALTQARRQKERTYSELAGEGGRARLVVLAAEVGGRWSEETAQFLRSLAKARSESSPFLLQNRVQAAYIRRWSGILACTAARSLALSLLERRLTPGTGADAPSVHEVLRDDRFA